MRRLQEIFGGAMFVTMSGDVVLSNAAPRVIIVNATGTGHKFTLPATANQMFTDPLRFLFFNVGSNAFDLVYTNSIVHTYYSITADAATNSFTAASGGLAIAPPGSYIITTGFSNSANNGTFQVLQRNAAGTQVWVSASLVNETVNVTPPVPPATTPLPPVSVSRGKITTLTGGNALRLMLGQNTVFAGFREYYPLIVAYNAARSFSSATMNGSAITSICSAVRNPPPPPPPPPPYDGETIDLSSCPTTKTITITNGIGSGAVWNGVWTVTKVTSGSVTYYRYVIDANHYIDLRYYPGGQGYGYQWQVVCTDLTRTINKRFGNNISGSCPPNTTYTCFSVPIEGANCTSGQDNVTPTPIVCTVSA